LNSSSQPEYQPRFYCSKCKIAISQSTHGSQEGRCERCFLGCEERTLTPPVSGGGSEVIPEPWQIRSEKRRQAYEKRCADDAATMERIAHTPLSEEINPVVETLPINIPTDREMTESERSILFATKNQIARRKRPTRRDPHQKPTVGGGYQTTVQP